MDDYKKIQECLKGNTKAYESLILKYQKPIFNVAYRLTRNFDDAEDIAQTTFIKAYENLKTFNSRYKFFSWIYRIAINEALNSVSRKSKKEEISSDLPAEEKSVDIIVNGKEMSNKIQEMLSLLDFNYRIVIVLKHFMNFSYKEICDILALPQKTVKSRLFTARRLLKDIFVNNKLISDD